MSRTSARMTGEQRVVLADVSWDVYESLLGDHHTRLTYDRGVLELMSPGQAHERISRRIGHLVAALVDVWGLDLEDLGSTTFKEPAWERGFEPDGCFYIRDAAGVRGEGDLDPQRPPSPEIVVEIDISRSSVDKLPVFAQFGVPEVWRHDGRDVTILLLGDRVYRPAETSRALPPLTAEVLARLVEQGLDSPRRRWLEKIRAWATTARAPE